MKSKPTDNEQDDQAEVEQLLNSPIGKALCKPGATFRCWRNTTPSNLWIESARGKMLFHSQAGIDCPVRQAFALLMHTNGLVDHDYNGPGWGQEESYHLSNALLARVEERKLLRKTAPAAGRARGRRL